MKKPPFFWVRKIAAELKELDTIPLFGNSPPFDWEHLSTLLSSSFHAKITIHPSDQQWKDLAEIKKGLGANFHASQVSFNPLMASVFWAMPRADLDKFTSHELYKKGKGKTSEIIRDGFYRYLLLEALSCLQQIEPMKKLTMQLEEEAKLEEDRYFCIDLNIVLDDKSCWGTLLIPAALRQKWIAYFEGDSSVYFPTPTARLTELVLGLKIGESSLHQEDWNDLKVGDFFTLDRSTYVSDQENQTASMHLNGTPLFQVKLKKNQIELLDYTFTYEDMMKENDSNDSLQPAEESMTSLKDIPLNITIELARVKMSLDQLMHLSPGNLLDFPIQPDQGVSLCIQGKKVGTGELVHLGEVLGVRILTMGS